MNRFCASSTRYRKEGLEGLVGREENLPGSARCSGSWSELERGGSVTRHARTAELFPEHGRDFAYLDFSGHILGNVSEVFS